MPGRKLHPPSRVEEYTARGWWSPDTIDALLRAQVARQPDRLAVVDPANKAALVGAEPRRLTWAELDAEVDRLATVLLDYGAEQGDVLAVQLPNTVELVIAYLASWRLGLIVTPLPVQFREHEIVELAALVEPKFFVTTQRIGDRFHAAEILGCKLPAITLAHGPKVDDGIVPLDQLLVAVGPSLADYVAAHPADPDDCVTICWTSGTESTPKGIPRCHYDWLAICWGTVEAPRLTEDDVLLNPFPMVNMAGIGGMFLPWLRVGCVLVQHHPFDLPTFLQQISAEKVTYTVAPPALLTLLLQREELLARADISSLRLIGSGSVPLQPTMVRGWQERHGIGIINFFGSNEGISLLTDPHDVPDPEQRARYFPRYGVPGYTWSSRVAEWTSVRLVDPATGEEVTEPGVPGELRLKGPTVFAGYLHGERLASPFDEQGYLRTGDVFVIAGADGQFLEYVDRAKDLVIRGGMNIAPAELEGLIAAHPAVADVAVVGYPDDVLGERVCAVVVLRDGAELDLAELVRFLQDRRIASYKLPERLELRAALPRNPVGKVLKRQLREEVHP
ncbi:class I adenylate-forming enzyme family protein [Dactylosporangium matsuzakiense]|uniref:AMP-dependent acyl-CoA synthetase n=1 Tax=Dactylosporangium matsuzakiense TaxID=53360 RepID=A0A9W6KR86_9ACTN|nr:class I adenylate-forming enzyme family protein [Dactylosporangium matsuzakiense]UWZ47430.1 acyl--CoA ligase [Dactylosporangium matsuzakiense]GLL05179.1 AMP-dependent acyl-CoA synthetase [Dactylosporangium matsuzakiense]